MSKTLESNLTEGNVTGKLLSFAWPLFVANLLVTFYGIVDTLVVGHFDGSAGISAVTTGSQLMNILMFIGMGFANGGQVLIAQLKGADDNDGLCKAIGSLVTLCTLSGLVVGAIGALITPMALRLLNTPAEAWNGARDYMIITSLGMVFMFISYAFNSTMRGLGDSRRPMLFIGVATVMNMILDVIFVGPLRMGARGAALATVFAIFCSALFAFLYLFRRKAQFAFDFKLNSFKLRRRWVGEHLRLGIPMALQSSVINISLAYVMSLVNVYGVAASSAVGIGGKLISVCCMPYHSTGTAAGAMCGQCVGAGLLDRVRETVNKTVCINLAVTVLTAVVIVFVPDVIIHLFDTNEEVVEICRLYLRLHLVHNTMQALFNAQNAACLGVGDTMLSAVAFITDGMVLRLAMCLIFTYVLHWGLFGVILATAVAPVGAEIIFGVYYWGGFWRRSGEKRYALLSRQPEAQ